AWSASWMALGMAAEQAREAAPAGMHDHAFMSHHAMEMSAQVADAHDQTHDSGDCDEHCMNCVAHCFGSGIASAFSHILNPHYRLSAFLAGDPLDRAFLLYRPPIDDSSTVS